MNQLTYTPDEDIRVHEEGAIRLICKAYQSHENGLPEWLKNSADAYAREDAQEAKRAIVVIFDYGRRGIPPSISCLDFSGMTSAMIEENFRIWADPEAAQRGAKTTAIQGGHGNGGKCYMTQMFEDYAQIYAVKKKKGNRYGVVGGSIRFGYIPDRQTGRDFGVTDVQSELEKALRPVRCSIRTLPDGVVKAIEIADGFTLVSGVGPKGYDNRIPHRHLIEHLQEHPQMIQTLELCKVYVVVNGQVFNQGKPLALPDIKPMAGAEKPRVIPIPAVLKDPVNETEVSTTNGNSLPGTLTLLTSDVSMRWGKKGRHNVIFRARSGYIGYVPVAELDIQSPYRDRIYGECYLEALEPFKQNERARLATSPLTRSVERFISEQIESYAKEFEARDRRRYDQEEKDALSKMNEALDRWKNRLLSELMRGLWGPGETVTPPRQPPLPTGKPAKLDLALTHPRAGIGIAFRPTLKFFDSTGKQIRSVPFRWVSEDTNVAIVDEDLLIINTFSYGQTGIYAETLDGKIRSNKALLEVVRILEVQISPTELQITAGSRQKLEAVCRLGNGEETSNIYLEWTENNPSIARVSSSGLVFGFSPGETEVTAGDDQCLAKNPAIVKVVPGGSRGAGDQLGKGFPQVLISEVNADPETRETVTFSPEYPPVWQRPQDVDRNIWWINSAAPFARLYLDASRGYGHDSREWRIYHLERYIDVMVQIALTHGPTEKQSLPVGDWILEWGAQAARIQEIAAASLSEFINTGKLPEE
ncbi:MAG TPA: Ig-like domain-containing protein [Candidatus Acidoferrales bacterium]|nr:Ig-like domain-containing protein [Candidatus Acidoferrales bacterium]